MGISGELGFVGLWIEEVVFPCGVLEDAIIGEPNDFHDERQLFLLTFSREQRHSSEKLGQDASETPHIDGSCVRNTKDDLRRTIEPRLDVSVNTLICKAAGAKVDDLDARFVRTFEKNVLWLEVAVNKVFLP